MIILQSHKLADEKILCEVQDIGTENVKLVITLFFLLALVSFVDECSEIHLSCQQMSFRGSEHAAV